METKIIIRGKPIAKARPRFARRGKFVKTFNPQETEEGRWLWEAQQQIKHKFSGPVLVTLRFYMPRPKSHYGTGRNAGKIKNSAPAAHTQKPDLDNLEKFVLDCLNGVAYDDDAQVITVYKKKLWNDEGMTLVTIKEIDPERLRKKMHEARWTVEDIMQREA